MTSFEKWKILYGNLKADKIEKEICETHGRVQNIFHSAVNAFIVLERIHDELVGTVKPVGVQKICGITL